MGGWGEEEASGAGWRAGRRRRRGPRLVAGTNCNSHVLIELSSCLLHSVQILVAPAAQIKLINLAECYVSFVGMLLLI